MRHTKPLLIACCLLTAPWSAFANPAHGALTPESQQELIELFRDLHAHPEVAGEEERTAGIVAKRLEAAGLEVRTGIGGHGVVAVLRGGLPGPVVAYRADMDAMAFPAPDPVPYASKTPGVRHVCGHDMHTTVGIGLALRLAGIQETLPGTVVFLFQPAEEVAEGAQAMLAAGAFKDPAPEAILALHCSPLDVGEILVMDEQVLAGLDLLTISLTGEGDLSGAAQSIAGAVASLNTLAPPLAATSLDDVLHQGDFVVGNLFSSDEHPEENRVELTGMLRANRPEVYAEAHEKLEQALASLDLGGARYELSIQEQVMLPMVNDPDLVKRVEPTLKRVLGDGMVTRDGVVPFFGEDFAFFQKEIPGAMFFLGVSNPEKGTLGMPHTPSFVADDGAIAVGVETMAQVLIDYLEGAGSE